ncbi:MAG: rhomboid family intramembrane serine protease [Candidatus Eremiobacteraeota bacterium]|nr:rhomboid family intramembrane serine protease [Candidatus Eremiobacteraeota bacterium]
MKVTHVLIAANVAVYLWVVVSSGGRVNLVSGFQDDQSFLAYGALYGPLVMQGQWWRLVSSAFLHDGLMHIGLNMFALWQVGSFVEAALGPVRMLLIYAAAMVGSGLAVVYFSYGQPTVGASGAIFGLFGALLAIGLRYGSRGRSLVAQTVPIILINLVFTFSVASISKAAHVGGLVVGICAGLLLFTQRVAQDVRYAGEPGDAEAPEARR